MKKNNSSFHDFVVHDLLAGVEGIRSRKMFGGYGIYRGPTFFALISSGTLYLKTDPALAREFKQHGSKPFVYEKKQGGGTKRVSLSSYWSVPEDAIEDHEEFLRWVERSLASIIEKNQRA